VAYLVVIVELHLGLDFRDYFFIAKKKKRKKKKKERESVGIFIHF
jgi:hypothetical protein